MAYELNLCLERIYGQGSLFANSKDKWKHYFQAYLENINTQREQGLVPLYYENPLGVQFELTHRCNLKCIQCYNNSGGHKSAEMSREMWLDIARQVREMGVFECVISGGEPLICDYVFDVMDVLHEYQTQFVFITNGMLLTNENIKRLLKYRYNWIQVSIDGFTPETHDQIRGVKGSWEAAVVGLKKLCDLGMPTVAACTVSKRNLAEVGDFIDMCGYLGVTRVVLGEMIPVGRAGMNLKEELLTQEDLNYLEEIINEKRDKWQDIMEISVPLPMEIQVKLKVLQPNGVMLIRPDGNVRIDCIIPFSVGNLFAEPLEAAWERAKMVQYNKDLHQYVLEIESNSNILESKFGVSYVTEDYSIAKAEGC
ncbi:MAG: radical SAM protein [Thermincola sp.]|nr:radical SAM protein [Thermincola sp.]MDT3702874.1 radical SAM protein [Thermincola sp.]